jgi:opacity protein-like surface antigen
VAETRPLSAYGAVDFMEHLSMSMSRWQHRKAACSVILVAAAWLGLARPALAQDAWPTVTLRGGGMLAVFTSEVQVNGRGIGTLINIENDLGFNKTDAAYFFDGVWRISRRNQFRVDYENLQRGVSGVTPARTFVFRDTTYTVNSKVDAELNTWFLSGTYGFAFVQNPKVEVGFTLGLTAAKVTTGIGLSLNVNGGATSKNFDNVADLTAPIPLPGVFWTWRPSRRVTVDTQLRLIAASVGDFSGSVWEAKAGAEFHLTHNLSLGAAYYGNRADIKVKKVLFDGQLKYFFNGPQAYLGLNF